MIQEKFSTLNIPILKLFKQDITLEDGTKVFRCLICKRIFDKPKTGKGHDSSCILNSMEELEL